MSNDTKKNLINVRIQSTIHSKLNGSLEHNLRTKSSRSDLNDDSNYLYQFEKRGTNDFISNGDDGITQIVNISHGTYSQNLSNYFSCKPSKNIAYNSYELSNKDRSTNREFKKMLTSIYEQDRLKHNALFKTRTRKNLKDDSGTWLEGVITFSEAIKEDLGTKYSQQQLEQKAIDITNDIAKYFKVEPKYVVLHLNETTPHFHFALDNFDEKGRSITHMFKATKHLSILQDIAFRHLKELGMKRGIKKAVSSKSRHNETIKYYESTITKLNAKLHEQNQAFTNEKKSFILLKNKYQNGLEKYNKLSSKYKERLNSYNNDNKAFKDLYEEVEGLYNKYSTLTSKKPFFEATAKYFGDVLGDKRENMLLKKNNSTLLQENKQLRAINSDKIDRVKQIHELNNYSISLKSSLKNLEKERDFYSDKSQNLESKIESLNQEISKFNNIDR